jgi:hypothetical protein
MRGNTNGKDGVLPDPGVAVVPIVAVHGAQVPWGKVVIDGVPVVPARHLPSMFRQLPAVLGPERVAGLGGRQGVPAKQPRRLGSRPSGRQEGSLGERMATWPSSIA